MARHPPDPELIQLVLEAARAGTPASEIATIAKCGEQTIRGWIKRYGGGLHSGAKRATPAVVAVYSGVANPEAHTPADDAPAPEPPADRNDSLAMARWQRDVAMHAADKALRLGNQTAAQRHMRDAANMIPTIARLEKAGREDADALHLSRAEIAADREALLTTVKQLLARPLLCEHCGRALSVQLAESER